MCKLLEGKDVDAIEITSGLAIDQTSIPFQKPTDNRKGIYRHSRYDCKSSIHPHHKR